MDKTAARRRLPLNTLDKVGQVNIVLAAGFLLRDDGKLRGRLLNLAGAVLGLLDALGWGWCLITSG